ncbi:hypothetical protein R3W88_025109 [Solanum pinnatisectum]|uniref:Retrotransposon Copia-like N-terminal domain-containing protein n=1 Tax=Solanum pinnatisectum TaxID=50273 RepID=A0AAV9M2M4_9SOLN|nr:hypothetical protein R3W88_025109 [Solanum pinnatisectum]
MAASSSSSLGLSPSSLHQLITICPIKLKPLNYLVWRTKILQLMQTLKVTSIIKDEAPSETIENAEGEPSPNPKFEDWEEHDVLVRSWISGTMTEESMFLITREETDDIQQNHIESAVAFNAQKSQGQGHGNYYRGRGNQQVIGNRGFNNNL